MLSLVYGLSDRNCDVTDLICDRGASFFAEHALKEFQQKCWNPDPADLHELEAETYRQTHVILYQIDDIIRKVKTERMETDTLKTDVFDLRNRYLSICSLGCSDFVLSRTYIIRHPLSHWISFICPDPASNHGAKNDPIPYVIGSPHRDLFFRPLARIIRT